MAVWKDIVFGRPDGIRQSIYRSVMGKDKAVENAPPAKPEPVYESAEQALNLGIEAPKNVTPPSGYEVVLHKDALEPGKVIEVIIAGNAIALARTDDGYFALDNRCPRSACALGEGSLAGNKLTCPTHGWVFDVTDGSCEISPKDTVPTYPVQIAGDGVCVKI
jgi:nitrite reductase/ring-hydroxylating ferredoxin subunit